MSPAERTEIVEMLEQSREEFRAALAGVSESLAATRPEAERWSVLECVEHVATVEEMFLKRLASGEHTEAPPEDNAKEASIAVRIVDRSTRRQAPETVLPKADSPAWRRDSSTSKALANAPCNSPESALRSCMRWPQCIRRLDR